MSDRSQASLFAGLDAELRDNAMHAVQALQSGQADAARNRFEQLLQRAPDDADLLRLTGMAQRMCGRLEQAVATLERAVRAAPDDPLAASSFGLTCLALGWRDKGLAELRRACDLAPQAAALWNNLGKALIDHGRVGDALQPLQTALDRDPGMSQARFSLAYALTVSGQADHAAHHYRQLLQQRPDDGEAWMGLAQLKSGQLDDQDIRTLQALLAGDGGDPGNRIALGFALGQALHDRQRYAEAFAAWEQANWLLCQRKPWDPRDFSARVDAAVAADWPVPDLPAVRPRVIFIVGLPRSGTSLTEQILACHPDVVAGGELGTLSHVLEEELAHRSGRWPDGLPQLPVPRWQQLGADYLARARHGLGAQPVLTDKRPGNWLFVPAAINMLPDARIVVCRRDPLEACFSCWRNRFSYDNQLFANDFESLAAHWHDFDRASRHWRERFPRRVLDFSYEALVEDKETAIRQLLDFCGLEFDPACLHPERGSGAVRTLSATQVRKPLRKGSAVAERYGELLDPLRRLLP